MYLIRTIVYMSTETENEAIDTLFHTYLSVGLALKELKLYETNMQKRYKCFSYDIKLMGIEELEKEEAKLVSELEYSSDSPYWPEERRVRNEFGQMCDAWFPAKKPVLIIDWTVNRWLECLEQENTSIAAGKEI